MRNQIMYDNNGIIRKMKKMRTILIIALLLPLTTSLAQRQRIPRQAMPHTAEEMVAFPETTDFQDAITILGRMAMKYENKTIIDPTEQTGTIGIKIPNMFWKTAFQRIVEFRNLEFKERPNYYEIVSGDGDKGSGTPSKSGQSEEAYSKDTREVQINAIFFQANRKKLQNAGINWNIVQKSPGFALRELNIGADFGIISDQASGDEESITGRKIGHQSIDEDGDVDVGALLNLFESKNLGKVLSKPSVKVVDGKQGEVHVGTQFAVNQRDFAGNTVTRFANAGTILRVSPKIIKDSSVTFIHLSIEAERSNATAGMGDRPEISTQKATTDVLLVDGEQTVIGGLIVQDKQETREGIPILKDLPWWVFGIRYLTGYNSTTIDRNELIVFIQVELADPLVDRMARKKREMLGKQARETQQQFDQDFDDLYSKKGIKKVVPVEEEIRKEDLDVDQQKIISRKKKEKKLEKPVTPQTTPEPMAKREPAVERDTKEIIDKLAKEEKQPREQSEKKKPKPEKKITATKTQKKSKPIIKKPVKNEEQRVVENKIQKKEKTIIQPTPEKEKPKKKSLAKKDKSKTEQKREAKINQKSEKKIVKKTEAEPEKSSEKKRKEPVVVKKPVESKEPPATEKTETVDQQQKGKARYTIQIFSSDNYEKTMEEINAYKEKGFDVYIVKKRIDGKIYFRVRSGRYHNFSDAKRDLEKIQQSFPNREDMWIDNL